MTEPSAITRTCPDCGKKLKGKITSKAGVLWWDCRDDADGVGCRARIYCGKYYTNLYMQRAAEAEAEGPKPDDVKHSDKPKPDAKNARPRRKAEPGDEPEPGDESEPERKPEYGVGFAPY